MAKGKHIAPKTRTGRASWGIVGLVFGLFLAMSFPVGAAVERYQFTDYTINVDSVIGVDAYDHVFNIRYNPCTDTYSGTGYSVYHKGSETLSNVMMSNDTLSFQADYDFAVYTWYPSFTLNSVGSLTFVDGYGSDNVNAATGTWSSSQTSYNHGEYVAESIDEYGPDARSCIGMPIVSNGKTG